MPHCHDEKEAPTEANLIMQLKSNFQVQERRREKLAAVGLTCHGPVQQARASSGPLVHNILAAAALGRATLQPGSTLLQVSARSSGPPALTRR